MSKLLPLFLIVCISTVAQAAGVYRWVDNDGQIHYSDHPTNGSESVELRESSVYTPRELPDISQDEEAADTDEEEGETCSILLKTVRTEEGIRFDIVVNGLDFPGDIEGKPFGGRDPSEGKAFGLIVARNIAEGEGGTISLETNENGFVFTLFFPNHPSE